MPTRPYVHTVQRVVTAPPAAVFEVLADPARHREIDGGGNVQGVATGPRRLGPGDSFGMDMRMGLPYRTGNRVVEFEEGRRIAWRTAAERGGRLLFGGHVWRYELVDRGDGTTLVRQSFDVSRARPRRLLALEGRLVARRMSASLERLAALFQR